MLCGFSKDLVGALCASTGPGVPSMFDSLEVKVLCPGLVRQRASEAGARTPEPVPVSNIHGMAHTNRELLDDSAGFSTMNPSWRLHSVLIPNSAMGYTPFRRRHRPAPGTALSPTGSHWV